MNLFRLKDGNYTNQKFNENALLLVALVLVCFAISPMAKAVMPAPDGGYAGGNTAEGQNALLSLTSGTYNTAVGLFSLRSNTTGKLNTAIGAGTLLANTSDQNTATGVGALLSNSSGIGNTANGAFALFSNTDGSENTAIGLQALQNNTSGINDTAIGTSALQSNTGTNNTGIGSFALFSNTTGAGNTALGLSALAGNTTGSINIALGFNVGTNVITANNVICIGADVAGADVSNTTWIGNVYNTTTQSGTTLPVIVSDGGQLGTTPSSRGFKKEIKPMDKASEAILGLKPVTFHYKSDTKGTPQFGLIAEEVAAVNPDLVVRDNNGEIYTVRYDAVNAMLLNEFLKEHKKTEKLEATVASLIATVKDQAAQIQKVSAQLEVNKSAPQTVENN